MRPFAFILLAGLSPAFAQAACPDLSGKWLCGTFGGYDLSYDVSQIVGADGKTTFSVLSPALGLNDAITLQEGADLAMPKSEGYLAVSSFSCAAGTLTLRSLLARRVGDEEVPAELRLGEASVRGETTIWNKTAFTFTVDKDGTVKVNGQSDFTTNDPALRPAGSAPIRFSCRRK